MRTENSIYIAETGNQSLFVIYWRRGANIIDKFDFSYNLDEIKRIVIEQQDSTLIPFILEVKLFKLVDNKNKELDSVEISNMITNRKYVVQCKVNLSSNKSND